ncbi:hypothetical protein K7X08_018347 [Anisodus acutangulus]|uniref:VOC domain-containing protein n=1 Tax=Anisodus acutangulus TaxID=402998 RepID=A0A9Q1LZ31_9SOLA|nr:hypothetical protein K7X08_018347 [Anisodus acutangulus]
MIVEIEEVSSCQSLPLLSLNHVSLLVRDVWNSVHFYEDVLGFCLVKRPSSFNFRGAWLYNYGVGIHLLENKAMEDYDAISEPRPINPKDNHISFQCTDVVLVKRRLEEMGMRYVIAVVEEEGIKVDQVHLCNKLASRHVRAGLAKPNDVPRCDICQNSPAFFYCEVDGSSLCLCDMMVHVGGKRTHSRYLLMRQKVEFPGDKSGPTEELARKTFDRDGLGKKNKMIDLNVKRSRFHGQASNQE